MYKKLLSIILCLSLMSQMILPVYAIAKPENTIDNDKVEQEERNLPYIVREDTSLREENTKTYVLSDGTYMVAMYPSAVHQKDENGVWEQIDNSLESVETLSTETNISVFKTSKENKSLDIVFNSSLQTNHIFSISNDEHTVSVGLVNRNSVKTPVETDVIASPPPAEMDVIIPENNVSVDDVEETITPDIDNSSETPLIEPAEEGNEAKDISDESIIESDATNTEEISDFTDEAFEESAVDIPINAEITEVATDDADSETVELITEQNISEIPENRDEAVEPVESEFPIEISEPEESVQETVNIENIEAEAHDLSDDTKILAPSDNGILDNSTSEDVSGTDGSTVDEAVAETVTEDNEEPAVQVNIETEQVSEEENKVEDNVETQIFSLADIHPELIANEVSVEPATINISSEKITPEFSTRTASLSDLVQNPDALAVDNLYQKVLYEEVFENVDLEYIAFSNTVKENIIVKAPLDSYEFAFEIDFDGLSYIINADKSISLIDVSGNVAFTIQSPVMFDANGLASDAVTYDIIENDGQHYLVVSADKEWVNAAEFPVYIDPTITEQIDINNSLKSSYVTEGRSYNDVMLLAVGRLPDDHKRLRGYIKFDLPDIPDGSIVSRAYLYFGIVEAYDYNGVDPRIYATAFMVPWAWNSATINWANQPGQPDRNPKDYSEIIESHDIYAGDKGCDIAFDITKAVNAWVQDPSINHGLMFADGYEENFYNHYTTLSTSLYGDYPMMVMTYRVSKGLESYWETYSTGITDAGTAHVNLYSGDLVVDFPIFSDSAQRMPFSYNLIYNSIDKGVGISDYNHGHGWSSNILQTLTTSAEGNAKYKYVDADGTPHYIILEDGKYIDEDGLGLTLTTSNGYVLEDENRTKYTFNTSSPGYLTKIEDTNGNQTTISHSSSKTTITSTGNRVFTVNKNSNKYITSFIDCLGKTTSFTYSSNRLTSIKYPDNKITQITYTSNGEIKRITGPNGYALEFEWDVNGRVTSITEYSGTTAGQKVLFDYSGYSTTKVRTSGQDDIISNNDDLITHYLFDEWGRVFTVYTTDKNNTKIYGVQNTGFTDAENGEASNRLTQNVAHGSTTVNLIDNGNLESTATVTLLSKVDWEGTSDARIVTIAGSSINAAYYGTRSAKIVADSNTGVAVAQRSISLPAGTYTLSGYARITDIVPTAEGGGAGFGVKFGSTKLYSELITGTNGSTFSIDSQSTVAANNETYITNNKAINEEVESGWQRLYVTFTLSSQTTVYYGPVLHHAIGTFRFDAIQLEAGNAMTPYNLIENAGFEASANDTVVPTGWTALSGINPNNKVWNHFSSITDDGLNPIAGSRAYRMEGRVTYGTPYNTGLSQTIPTRGEVGDVYTISGWIRLWTAPDQAFPNATYQIACNIKYSDGSSLRIAQAKANPYFIGWQYVSESFILKNDKGSGVTITGLEVVLQMDNVPFYAAFDNIHLTKDEGLSYVYDSEGKLVSSQAIKEQKANITYNETTDLPSSYIDVDGNTTTYSYNSTTRNLLTSTAPSGLVTTLNYSSGYGANPNSQKISNGSVYIETSQVMKDSGNFAYSSTNEMGKTSYVYYNIYDPDYTGVSDHILPDPLSAYPYASASSSSGASGYTDPNPNNNILTGQIYAIKDEAGIVTRYEYTDDDYLSKVSKDNMSVNYAYSNGRLASITNNSAVYGFTYNTYGAVERIKAGGTDILVNTYKANNGKLLNTQYAGTTVNYTYDELDRVSQVSYDNGDTVKYKYDGNGNLVQRSQTGGLKWNYVYDNSGMLVGSSNNATFWSKYKYDAAGRLTALIRVNDGKTHSTGFAYNKFGQAEKVKMTGGLAEVNGTNTYDTLGRLTKKLWDTAGNKNSTSYTYKPGANGSSSTLIDTVTFSNNSSAVTGGRQYIYDDVGNITQEKQRQTTGSYTDTVRYTYDDNYQLIRVDDAVKGETVQYTYDLQGNMTQRTYHAYTTSTPGAATRTDTWTYGGLDGNVLTVSTINGVTTNYSYPHYGMPSNWTGNRALTWINGIDLASIGGTTFTYDGEGQRVSKTTGATTTSYTYEGDQLVMQTTGNTSLFFLYDANGLIGFDHIVSGTTTAKYYYQIDGKGEIVGITDTAGNVVAKYTYDAWGNPISITDGNGSTITDIAHIGNINPFRYKSYYYDTDIGLYYLNSRYYDPQVCRFISADSVGVLTSSPTELTDKNLFNYCDNNPVIRTDNGGQFWDIVFDIVSVVTSVVDVIKNPTNIVAWVGLAADIVSLATPGITGGGAAVKAIAKSDDVLDTAKAVYKAADTTSDIKKATGSYEIVYKSGNTYVGKGGYKRALESAQRNAKKYTDEVASFTWKSAPNNRTAMINEYKSMCKFGGPNNTAIKNTNSYNKIWSPGRKYYYQDHGSYFNFGGREW